MHSLINLLLKAILLSILTVVSSSGSDETLYTCFFDGKETTYHKNEALRMELLGAECRLMSQTEHITCSMDGVRLDYSRKEAEELLENYPNAICEIGNMLYASSTGTQSAGISVAAPARPMAIQDRLTLYFPVNSNRLSPASRDTIRMFAQRHRQTGHTFTITGFASATGSHGHNHTLSLRRAGIVRSMLISNGVNADNILSTDALGEESLRHNTRREERKNRAVEIKAYGR